jgi:thiosulfate dehydrogenase [quinone] large subunit
MSEKLHRYQLDVENLENPAIIRKLFSGVKWAWIWLPIRVYLGVMWLNAGWGKITNPAWVGSGAGSALSGFVQNALTKTSGAHPDVQGWYASFLKQIVLTHTTLWSYMVAFGETLVGVALILGIFTGVAALFGVFMNESYLLAGSVSVNPIMLMLAVLTVLAWKVAGWWGFDRWLLPILGTPWKPGPVFNRPKGSLHQKRASQPM